jgi:hypothetical protein
MYPLDVVGCASRNGLNIDHRQIRSVQWEPMHQWRPRRERYVRALFQSSTYSITFARTPSQQLKIFVYEQFPLEGGRYWTKNKTTPTGTVQQAKTRE